MFGASFGKRVVKKAPSVGLISSPWGGLLFSHVEVSIPPSRSTRRIRSGARRNGAPFDGYFRCALPTRSTGTTSLATTRRTNYMLAGSLCLTFEARLSAGRSRRSDNSKKPSSYLRFAFHWVLLDQGRRFCDTKALPPHLFSRPAQSERTCSKFMYAFGQGGRYGSAPSSINLVTFSVRSECCTRRNSRTAGNRE